MRAFAPIAILFSGALILLGCGITAGSQKYNSSLVEYLYPDQKVCIVPSIPCLQLPLKIGIAFVPEKACSPLSEHEKNEVIEQVRTEFCNYDYIESIEIIPSNYLTPKGGFENLAFLGNIFNIDVAVLISFDQHLHTKENIGALTYLTLVGAFIIPGDINDISTMVDATVYHIESKKMLFRAPGCNTLKSWSTFAGLDASKRSLSREGFKLAIANMIPHLKVELERFKRRMIEKPLDYAVVHREGYHGGGSLDVYMLLIGLSMLFCRHKQKRQHLSQQKS